MQGFELNNIMADLQNKIEEGQRNLRSEFKEDLDRLESKLDSKISSLKIDLHQMELKNLKSHTSLKEDLHSMKTELISEIHNIENKKLQKEIQLAEKNANRDASITTTNKIWFILLSAIVGFLVSLFAQFLSL